MVSFDLGGDGVSGLSPGHRALMRRRRFGAGSWWVELARLGAAALCVLAWGAVAFLVAWGVRR